MAGWQDRRTVRLPFNTSKRNYCNCCRSRDMQCTTKHRTRALRSIICRTRDAMRCYVSRLYMRVCLFGTILSCNHTHTQNGDVLIIMNGRSRLAIDPRNITMPGQSTSGFHRPGNFRPPVRLNIHHKHPVMRHTNDVDNSGTHQLQSRSCCHAVIKEKR